MQNVGHDERNTNTGTCRGRLGEGGRCVPGELRGKSGEVGAACCVYAGGLADRETNRPWGEDTIVLIASTTKGATAICAHLLAQRGELDLEAPVVKYWPEFGAAG